MLGICGALLTVALHGLLLSNPEARAGVLGYESALALALIPGAVLLAISAKRMRSAVTVLVVTSAALLAVVGFRVTVALVVLTYLALNAMGRRLPVRKFVAGFAALLVAAGLINAYRQAQYEAQSGSESPSGTQVFPTSVLARVPALTPLYYSIPHECVAVLRQLEELVPAEEPFANGRLQFATFRTLLPGRQLDPRSAVTQIVYATTELPTTLTRTILGGPYGDFGERGVIVEMALLGVVLGLLYSRGRARASPSARLAYAYALAVAVVGIHVGVLDVNFVVGVPAMTILALWFAGRSLQRAPRTRPAFA